MRTLAVVNRKGGTAKTTTVVNLAATLASRGARVLVVDLDAQSNATAWLGCLDGGRLLHDVLTNNGKGLEGAVVESNTAGADLIPASAWLSSTERVLSGEPGAELVFRKALRALPPRWDYVLVDAAPTLGLLVVSALTAADAVLVPVEPSPMALSGVASLLDTVEMVRDRLNPALVLAAVIPSRVDSRTTLARDVVKALEERFGELVSPPIRESIRLREAAGHSQPIHIYDPKGTGSADFAALAAFIETATPAPAIH